MTRKERMDPGRCRNETQSNHLRNIEETGLSILSVFDNEQAIHWTYSIGLWQQHRQPEIILFGMQSSLAASFLNHLNRMLQKGSSFPAGYSSEEVIVGYTCYFEAITPQRYGDFLAGAEWFYDGQEFQSVQMIWPTTGGLYPWELTEDDAAAQPIISSLPRRALQ